MREIYKVIDNLDNNKAPGPGYINAWALKSGKYALGTHLQIIFNNFIQEKVFPTILKDAQITPIFKKGDVSVVAIYKKYFDFHSRKLSTDVVLYFNEKIIGNKEDNDTGAVFLDLAKAFNSISHEIFLKKAENFNLSQSTTFLLNSFLEPQTQCVKLGIDLTDKKLFIMVFHKELS